MSPGKRFEEMDDDQSEWLAERRSHLRTMLSRAAIVYLVLFMGLALAMSLLGINPLVNNGLMPKVLLVFVGLALVIALANTLTDLSREHGRNWLRLVRGRVTTGKRLDE
jgi:zinc transporter ZupT